MNMKAHFLTIGLVLLASSCGGGAEEHGDQQATERLVISDDGGADAVSLYQMPTPNELFSIVREMAGEGQKRMMNPANNADRFVSLAGRACNFGIYATDLVYASYFKLNVEVVRYYLTVKKLGDELGLAAVFTDQDFARLESNLSHGDSLEVISNEAYYRAYEKMQDERMGPTLGLVLVGGWVESMHLVMRQITMFDPDDPLVARVAEQKVSLEHLLDMLRQYKDDPNVGPVRKELVDIRNIYDQLQERRTSHVGTSSSGRMVLGDDVSVRMTSDQYDELEKKIEALREELIRPEDVVKVKTNA
ncbi:MAG: hypothetical protein H6595_12625 [Flavobacteriales bacterium]|nr:hypothetical protein [Flavobacteriales bacterium]MCB9168307.1 hypothetical protein [Flavobacteriales bacterium]